MMVSRLFLPTLRDAPADAELPGHRLLVRGGFIRRMATGLTTFLPLGWRVHQKVAQIVREEMAAIGGQEMQMPALVPGDMVGGCGAAPPDAPFALEDHGGRALLLGAAHEEVATDIVRGHVRSWRQLPITLFHVHTAFRDDPRPRGGLIRAREFTMMDAYGFGVDEASAGAAGEDYAAACRRILARCGVECVMAETGGDDAGCASHEFVAIAGGGEDSVLQCTACGYAATAEHAAIAAPPNAPSSASATPASEVVPTPDAPSPASATPASAIAAPPNAPSSASATPASEVVPTPGAHTVAQVCAMLSVGPDRLMKTVIVSADGQPAAALVRGDRQLNLAHLRRVLGAATVELAADETVERVTGAPVGFAGPVGLAGVRIVADDELRGTSGMVVGANAADAHRIGVVPGVDFAPDAWAGIRVAGDGDRCARTGCAGVYREMRGIALGSVKQRGSDCGRAMGAQVQAETGEMRDLHMVRCGIAVSRIVAAIAEMRRDDRGILWPAEVAPFHAVVLAVNPRDDAQRDAAERLHGALGAAGIDALYDDRDERSGVKFADADLTGCPVRVVAGRAVPDGHVEVAPRADRSAARLVAIEDVPQAVRRLLTGGDSAGIARE